MIPGKTRVRAEGEVVYYPFDIEGQAPSVFPNVRGLLPFEYGGDFCLEAMTADCGWIASSIDVAKFVSAVFGDSGKEKQPLSPEMTKFMVSRPDISSWKGSDSFFAYGWEIENASSKENFIARKRGCLAGSESLVVHHPDGTTLAFAANSRPQEYLKFEIELLSLEQKTWKSHKYLAEESTAQKKH